MYVDASALLVNYVNSGLIDGFFLHNTKLTLLSMTTSKGLSLNWKRTILHCTLVNWYTNAFTGKDMLAYNKIGEATRKFKTWYD